MEPDETDAPAELIGWVVNARISGHLRRGREPGRFYQGTPMFAPGTKVFVSMAQGGPGNNFDRAHVAGLRRVSRRFTHALIRVGVLTDMRIKSLYSAKVAAALGEIQRETWAEFLHLDRTSAEETLHLR